MPSREQVERITNRFYKESKEAGSNASRDDIRKEIVKRAKRIENKNK